jgi:hypothetical protein
MSVLSRLAGPVGIGAIAAVAFTASASAAEMQLPSDVEMTCPVSEKTFQSWLQDTPSSTLDSWRADKNAAFKPASSVTFQKDNDYKTDNCDFYKWGQQMFLWLTSPDTSDGAGWVLTGPSIYNVLPTVDNKRKLQGHGSGNETLALALRDEKDDEIGEVGQAGRTSGVLMSQTGSLVYYGVHVNDFYATFATGYKNGPLKETKYFARTAADQKKVEDYAQDIGVKIDAPETLAIELKTSWVRADTLKNKDDYFTMHAFVPEYVEVTGLEPRSLVPLQTPNQRPVELALVGMHVVGTVQHHPEFVWASFEHINNAPNAPYYYHNKDGKKTETVDPQGSYLFADPDTVPSEYHNANVECMHVHDGRIVANTKDKQHVCPGGIAASNTVRVNPWGAITGDTADPAVVNNTLLISLNRSARGWLANDDVRRNYVQIGGLWTKPAKDRGVDAPIPLVGGFGDDKPTYNDKTSQQGSRQLANATMETYEQANNCFACHQLAKSAENSFTPFGLSHIFSQIEPLN